MKLKIFIFLSSLLLSGFAFAANAGMQSIDGAFAFPSVSNKNSVIVRISVNPKSVHQQKTTPENIMHQITVIACAAGSCNFTKANTGLGFYETSFQLNEHEFKQKLFNLQVVACSSLGCVQRTLPTKIVFPSDKP